MSAIDLIYRAISTQADAAILTPQQDGVCCVTGVYGPVVDRRSVLGSSFTNGDLLACPESPYIGVPAATVLRYKWERMSSWWCDGSQFVPLKRVMVRERVLHPIHDRPWCGYATTTYKKHGALLSPVNVAESNLWLWDTLVVDLSNRDRVHEIWDRLFREICAGIWRTAMETLDPPAGMLARIDVKRWFDFLQWASFLYRDPLYQFLVYLLPSQEELKQIPNKGGEANGERQGTPSQTRLF